jgi:hypothetical protein
MKTFCIFDYGGTLVYNAEYDNETTVDTFISNFTKYDADAFFYEGSEYLLVTVSSKFEVQRQRFTYKVAPSFVLLESSK